jgi:hypothetical protein
MRMISAPFKIKEEVSIPMRAACWLRGSRVAYILKTPIKVSSKRLVISKLKIARLLKKMTKKPGR